MCSCLDAFFVSILTRVISVDSGRSLKSYADTLARHGASTAAADETVLKQLGAQLSDPQRCMSPFEAEQCGIFPILLRSVSCQLSRCLLRQFSLPSLDYDMSLVYLPIIRPTYHFRFLTDPDSPTVRPRLQRIDAFYHHVASCPGAVLGLVEALQGSLISLPSFAVKDHRDRTREASALSAPIKVLRLLILCIEHSCVCVC